MMGYAVKTEDTALPLDKITVERKQQASTSRDM